MCGNKQFARAFEMQPSVKGAIGILGAKLAETDVLYAAMNVIFENREFLGKGLERDLADIDRIGERRAFVGYDNAELDQVVVRPDFGKGDTFLHHAPNAGVKRRASARPP